MKVIHTVIQGLPEAESYDLDENGFHITLYPFDEGYEAYLQVDLPSVKIGPIRCAGSRRDAIETLKIYMRAVANAFGNNFHGPEDLEEVFIESEEFEPTEVEEEEEFDPDFLYYEEW